MTCSRMQLTRSFTTRGFHAEELIVDDEIVRAIRELPLQKKITETPRERITESLSTVRGFDLYVIFFSCLSCPP